MRSEEVSIARARFFGNPGGIRASGIPGRVGRFPGKKKKRDDEGKKNSEHTLDKAPKWHHHRLG